MIKLTLPWPPSVNNYWKRGNAGNQNGLRIGSKGRLFRQVVAIIVMASREYFENDERLKISIVANAPDRRKRDLDNLLKPTLDALEHAKLFDNDSQIDELRITRGDVVSGGELIVTIDELIDSL